MNKQFVKPNGWTEKDKEFLIKNYLNCDKIQLEKVLHRTHSAIQQMARKMNLYISPKKSFSRHYLRKGGLYLTGSELGQYRRNAKAREISFFPNMSDIDIINHIEKIYISQNFQCKLSGQKVYFNTVKSDGNSLGCASIDRINTNLGYEIGNIQILHKDINTMKWNFNQQNFLNLCKLVVNHQNGVNGIVV